MTRKEEIEKGLKYFENNPKRLSALYFEMYRTDICLTCPGSLQQAYKKLYHSRGQIIPSIVMKYGKMIDTNMWDDDSFPKGHFTHRNTPDELALRFIEKGFGDYFI